MNLRFDSPKMLAAVAYVCNTNNGKYDKLALIKAIYMAERKSIVETLHTMTGDTMQCLKNGPVLKRLHEAIRGQAIPEFQSQWNKYFTVPSETENNVKIKEMPDLDELSYADMEFLNDGVFFIESCPKGSLIDKVHDLPEWKISNKKGEKDIDIAEILKDQRQDLSPKIIKEIKSDILA